MKTIYLEHGEQLVLTDELLAEVDDAVQVVHANSKRDWRTAIEIDTKKYGITEDEIVRVCVERPDGPVSDNLVNVRLGEYPFDLRELPDVYFTTDFLILLLDPDDLDSPTMENLDREHYQEFSHAVIGQAEARRKDAVSINSDGTYDQDIAYFCLVKVIADYFLDGDVSFDQLKETILLKPGSYLFFQK